MTDVRGTAERIRREHFLNISLATAGKNQGSLKEACDLAEQAVTAALLAAEAAGMERAAKVAEDLSIQWNLPENLTKAKPEISHAFVIAADTVAAAIRALTQTRG